MATTDFVPYATQAGALVEDQAAYVADPQTALGQQDGIADPSNANKAWRQGTVMASAWANVIVAKLGISVPDDGNLANLISFLESLLSNTINLQCTFKYVSPSLVNLVPLNGDNIIIDGVQYQVPSVGVSAGLTGVYIDGTSGQNLVANTGYYVSVREVSGTLTLAFWLQSTYSHAPDTTAGNVGVEVITLSGAPISTDTLVGQIFTITGPAYEPQVVRSWLSKIPVAIIGGTVSGVSTSSTTPVDLSPSLHISWLGWANERTDLTVVGVSLTTAADIGANVQLSIDSAAVGVVQTATPPANSADMPVCLRFVTTGLSEGIHTAGALGSTGPSTTATFSLAILGSVG
jgi:hypothetical protein